MFDWRTPTRRLSVQPVDIDTFFWYKGVIVGGCKYLILLILRGVRDNPFLGTIPCSSD